LVEENHSRDLNNLRASLEGTVAALLSGGDFARSTGGSIRGERRVDDDGEKTKIGSDGRPRIDVSPASAGNRDLRDERSMRALAKEIKRLITEDARRGIGI
jgi:hypothetical protein